MPDPKHVDVLEEAVKLAQRATGSTDAWCELCLDAAYPAILTDLKERLLSKEAVEAALLAEGAVMESEIAGGELTPEKSDRMTRAALEAAFNKAIEGKTSTQGGFVARWGAGDAGSGPETSERCGGSGTHPHRRGAESAAGCSGCPDCKPEGETDHA